MIVVRRKQISRPSRCAGAAGAEYMKVVRGGGGRNPITPTTTVHGQKHTAVRPHLGQQACVCEEDARVQCAVAAE